MAALTDRERAVLTFEGSAHWNHQGAKEDAIRRQFDLSPTRYYQILNTLIDRPEALAEQPMLVKRLQRVRDQRRRGGTWVAVEQ